MTDTIVEEVRKARDEHAKKFNYDLAAIVADIQKQLRVNLRYLMPSPTLD